MKHACTRMLLVVWLSLFGAPAAHSQPLQLREKVAQSADNIVRVEAVFKAPSQGFGYVVAATNTNLFVLTARHVVAEQIGGGYQAARTIRVTTSDGTVLQAEGVHFLDDFLDLAILRLPRSKSVLFKPDVLAQPQVVNDEVWLYGYQGRMAFVGQPGRIREIRSNSLALSGAGGWQGSSGAPVFSASGLSAIYTGVNGPLGVGIPIHTIGRLAIAKGLPWQLKDSGWLIPSIGLALERMDGLQLPVNALSAGIARRYAIPGSHTVSPGDFVLEFDNGFMLCEPARFTVRRNEPGQAIKVDCRPQLQGNWHGSYLQSVVIDELQDGVYSVLSTGRTDEPARWVRGRLLAKGTSTTMFQLDLTDLGGAALVGSASLSTDLKTLRLQFYRGAQRIDETLRR